MKFIQTTSGELVNLDFVERIVPLERDPNRATLRSKEDTGLGYVDYNEIRHLTSVVIPASGVTAVVLSDCDGEIFTNEVHVVAWRVSPHGADPVLAEEPLRDDLVLIKQPDGVLVDPENSAYKNLDEALDAFRRRRAPEKTQ